MVLLFRRGPRLRNILYTVRSKCLFFFGPVGSCNNGRPVTTGYIPNDLVTGI